MAISQSTSLEPVARRTSVPSGTRFDGTEAVPQFKQRVLRISDVCLTHDTAPFIRMSGKWLGQAGFHSGAHIRVTVTPQRLVIEPTEPAVDHRREIEAEQRAALRETALRDLAASVVPHPAPVSTQAIDDKLACNVRRKIRCLPEVGSKWPDRIGAALKPALGDVLVEERSRLEYDPEGIASVAGISGYRYRAFDAGTNQPDVSTFVAIAWVLNQDPCELLAKVLAQMGLPRGTRPMIPPRRI